MSFVKVQQKKKQKYVNYKKKVPSLAQGMYNTQIVYKKDPFLWAMYSFPSASLLAHASGRLSLSWVSFGGGFYWVNICCMGEGRRFWSRAAWCRLCVLTHVGSCVPNYQAKSDKTTFTGRHCRCLVTSSCLLFVVYTKMHWIKCLY